MFSRHFIERACNCRRAKITTMVFMFTSQGEVSLSHFWISVFSVKIIYLSRATHKLYPWYPCWLPGVSSLTEEVNIFQSPWVATFHKHLKYLSQHLTWASVQAWGWWMLTALIPSTDWLLAVCATPPTPHMHPHPPFSVYTKTKTETKWIIKAAWDWRSLRE